ncbi:MAG: ABC transporter permease [Propionibacterium sp.]
MTSVTSLGAPSSPSAPKATRSRSFSGLPRWLFVPAVLGAVFIVLPLVAMATRMQWSQFGTIITSSSSLDALVLSIQTSVASMVVCIVFGVPMAMVLAREEFPGQQLIRSLVLLPLVLPPVVGGIALLYTFGRRGLLAPVMDFFGISIAFSTVAVVLAQSFVAMPFLVVSLEGTLRTVGQRYELVAATLGARPSTVLRKVTLPLVLPGLASAAMLSFARALGEFGATLTFAGSLQGVTRTMPLEINLQNSGGNPDAAVALSLVLVAVAIIVTAVTTKVSEKSKV